MIKFAYDVVTPDFYYNEIALSNKNGKANYIVANLNVTNIINVKTKNFNKK